MDPVSKAQQSSPEGRPEKRFKGRGKATQFKPGQSGNPGGTSQAQYLSKIYREILEDPKNRAAIARNILRILTSRGMAAVLLLREITERTEGKVKDDVNVNVSGTVSLSAVIEERRKKLHDSIERQEKRDVEKQSGGDRPGAVQ